MGFEFVVRFCGCKSGPSISRTLSRCSKFLDEILLLSGMNYTLKSCVMQIRDPNKDYRNRSISDEQSICAPGVIVG
jgi:hypothetical protein